MELRLIARTDFDAATWNAWVDAAAAAWFFHRHDVIGAWASWGGRVDASVALVADLPGKPNMLVGIVPAYVTPGLGVFAQASPVFADNLAPKEVDTCWAAAEAHLVGVGAKHAAPCYEAQIAPLTPDPGDAAHPGVNPLLWRGFENAQTQTPLIDLTQTPEAIFAGYNATTRKFVRRMEERNDWHIRAATPADLAAYYALHVETYTRTGVRPHNKAYFAEIFNNLLPAGLCQIWLYEEAGQIQGAANIATYKQQALYWTTATAGDKAQEVSRMLLHHCIMAAKQAGCLRFDVNEVFPQLRDGKLAGITRFKLSFGGRLVPLYRGRLPLQRRGQSEVRLALHDGLNAAKKLGRALLKKVKR